MPNTLQNQMDGLNISKQEKSTTEVLNDLYQMKKKYQNYQVYVYECVNCQLFIMLHQKQCPHCKAKNMYFDDSLKVNE